MLSSQLQQFIHFTSGQNIIDICKPLEERFNINYYLYVRDYKDGRRIWFTTNGKWTEYFYQHELYQVSAFENSFIPYKPGYYLWSTLPGQKVFNIAREFNIDHGMTIVTDHQDYYEFFHFATTPENNAAVNFYMNHMDILQKFMGYFVDKAKDIIKKADKMIVDVPHPTIVETAAQNTIELDYPVNDFLSSIDNGKYCLKNLTEEIHITKREADCLTWFLKGKTMEEIALLENISKRTVETYTDQIKRKLNCHKPIQLGYKLANLGFLYN